MGKIKANPTTKTAAPMRSMSVQGHVFRELPIVKDASNYIWITKDILEKFKTQKVKSHKVTLKFKTVTYEKQSPNSSKHELPPLFAERIRMLHEKAATSINFEEYNKPCRPMKVIVDDITKIKDTSGSRNHSRDKTDKIVLKSANQTNIRSLDSGDDDTDFPLDAIEKVARANTVMVDTPSHVLPHIRAAPCPIHTKKDRIKGQDTLHATNTHVREIKTSRRSNPHPIKNITIQQHIPSHPTDNYRDNRTGINVRIPEQFPRTRPTLPKHLPSKEFVMSWLMHGSEPTGSNHFPDIIPTHLKVKSKGTPRKSEISE